MKKMPLSVTAFNLRPFGLIIIIIMYCSFFSACDAQSIVGKWHRGGTKMFVTDKATGEQKPLSDQQQKQFDKAAAASEYNEVLEFKSDNTYTDRVSAKGREATQHTEKYSLSGNKLDMNIPPVKNEKTTITIKSLDAHTMVWDLVFMGRLTEVVYTKM